MYRVPAHFWSTTKTNINECNAKRHNDRINTFAWPMGKHEPSVHRHTNTHRQMNETTNWDTSNKLSWRCHLHECRTSTFSYQLFRFVHSAVGLFEIILYMLLHILCLNISDDGHIPFRFGEVQWWWWWCMCLLLFLPIEKKYSPLSVSLIVQNKVP